MACQYSSDRLCFLRYFLQKMQLKTTHYKKERKREYVLEKDAAVSCFTGRTRDFGSGGCGSARTERCEAAKDGGRGQRLLNTGTGLPALPLRHCLWTDRELFRKLILIQPLSDSIHSNIFRHPHHIKHRGTPPLLSCSCFYNRNYYLILQGVVRCFLLFRNNH